MGKRVMVFDDSENSLLEETWKFGAQLYKLRGDFDKIIGVHSFDEMFHALALIDDYLDSVQIWCHGLPGWVIINNQWTRRPFGLKEPVVREVASKLTEESLLWFRTCATFAGPRGKEFAESAAEDLGCRVAGHTHLIAIWQAGLHSLGPGEKAAWSDQEGYLSKRATDDVSAMNMKWSQPWSTKSIFCMRGEIPQGW